MRYWPRRVSEWDGVRTAPVSTRSGPDPINPLRIARHRRRGLTYREIGILIAQEDGRRMPYVSAATYKALRDYERGIRDEDGERAFRPAQNKCEYRQTISLGAGIGQILFRS